MHIQPKFILAQIVIIDRIFAFTIYLTTYNMQLYVFIQMVLKNLIYETLC